MSTTREERCEVCGRELFDLLALESGLCGDCAPVAKPVPATRHEHRYRRPALSGPLRDENPNPKGQP